MNEKVFIRTCLLYEFDQGNSAAEAGRNIRKVYGEEVISDPAVRKWFSRFKEGDRSLDDQPREGRPQVLDDNDLKKTVDENPFLTLRELAQMFGSCHNTIKNRMEAIGKVNKRGRWLPHELSHNNKLTRVTICSSLLTQIQRTGSNRFWESFLTSDEKWILYDNTSRRNQWLDPKQKPVGVAKPSRFCQKAMLCVWWNIYGLVHFEVLDGKKTVDSELYCAQLERVNQALVAKGMDPAKIKFLHDNAKPHVSSMTQDKLEELGWEVLPHAPYSPDLAPSDYHLFRSMQHSLKDQEFTNLDQVRFWVSEFFNAKPQEFFSYGIKGLRERWREVIRHNGEYCFD